MMKLLRHNSHDGQERGAPLFLARVARLLHLLAHFAANELAKEDEMAADAVDQDRAGAADLGLLIMWRRGFSASG
jgi:hypothetical protein